jgi:thiol-disulfide isomerase/thioredoxin
MRLCLVVLLTACGLKNQNDKQIIFHQPFKEQSHRMDSALETSPAQTPQATVAARLARAQELQQDNNHSGAIGELEAAYAQMQATPYQVEFKTHVQLVIELAAAYLKTNELGKARHILEREAVFAEKVFQIMQATGTPYQKREAAAGRIQLRDRASQVALLGMGAPEISIKHWLKGEPATLSSLRGQVVLLEFWATWCKPCREMFKKLKELDEAHRARGLEIVAITRHYLAERNNAQSEADELTLMRNTIEEQGVRFRVGVAEDEGLQELYGAIGLPTLALIDRRGIVRYAHFGGGPDTDFENLLDECLNGGA